MADSRPVHRTETPTREEDRDLFEGPRITSDGLPIIEVQRGQAPAPNPHSGHRLVDFKKLQMVLLGDKEGTVRYRCAQFKNGVNGERCWRDDFDNPRSAVAHINNHGQVRTPDYPESTLRLLIRLVKTFDAAGYRNYAVLAAEELNRQGVPTVNNEPWHGQQVSKLFLAYKDKFQVRVSQEHVRRATATATVTDVRQETTVPTPQPAQPITPPPVTPVVSQMSLADLDRISAQLLKDTDQLFDMVKAHATNVVAFVETVGTKLAEAAAKPDVDPETVEKARRWDEMRRLMAGPQ